MIELRANDSQINIFKLRQSLLNMNLGDVNVKQFGNENDYLIKFEKKMIITLILFKRFKKI